MKSLSERWDLEAIFPGGSESSSFQQFLGLLEQDIHSLRKQFSAGKPQNMTWGDFLTGPLDMLHSSLQRIHEAESFTACLMAQNQDDKKAVQLSGKVLGIMTELKAALTQFDELIVQVPDSEWEAWLEQENARQVRFNLEERRAQVKDRMDPSREILANDLAIDGYHGWGELYNTTVGLMQVSISENGEEKLLSVGQANNRLYVPDRNVRKDTFERLEAAWSRNADFCADALNRIAGFRLQLYKNRNWDKVLKEPLEMNRMSEQTLNVMWEVIERNKPKFYPFLERKAQRMGVEKLSWYDVDAPTSESSGGISYDDAANTIVEQFNRFSKDMGEFAKMALENQWIEAEDRPGKRPGGFCTSFPISGQTRIFMTFSGVLDNLFTLAHELGHAYHQHVMNDMPALSQEYAMNVAETASTFAELIVSDAAVRHASSEAERVALLEEKVTSAVTMYMNIHARFLFETRFYEERKNGLIGVPRLNELMEQAQRDAYGDKLDVYHPLFWASKLHFYATDVPFYNFPYTFGYLFSAGIYAYAREHGEGFGEKYVALLRDTASMTVEELASKHLGVDLTKPDFWQSGIDITVSDAEMYLRLTE